jgi:integrase/recombinase XerC
MTADLPAGLPAGLPSDLSSGLPATGRPEVDAALILLAKLGVTPADLLAGAAASRPPVPTFAEFVPLVVATVTTGTLKAYGTYWNRVVEE